MAGTVFRTVRLMARRNPLDGRIGPSRLMNPGSKGDIHPTGRFEKSSLPYPLAKTPLPAYIPAKG